MSSARLARVFPASALAFALTCACGVPPGTEPRASEQTQAVVQGSLADIADFPATIAMLDTFNGNSVFCTGTLLDARHVLTAAHCVANLADTPTRIDVVVGYATASEAPEASRFNVADLTVHPDWTGFPRSGDPDGLDVTNDVAVLTLSRDVPNPQVASVLPDARIETDLAERTSLEIVGFGKDDDGARGVLRRGSAPIRKRTAQLLLAGELGSADSCEYDSGGPLYLLADDGVFLVGITSREWPGATSLPCGEGGVYTMPMAYRAFIEAELGAPLPSDMGGDVGGKPVVADAGTNGDAGALPAPVSDGDPVLAVDEASASGSDAGCSVRPGRASGATLCLWLGLLVWVRRRLRA